MPNDPAPSRDPRSEQKREHGFPLAGVLLPKLLFICALLFRGPAHHLAG